MSMQPAVSSWACVREVEANFSRLGMGPTGQTSRLGMGPPEQTLVDWTWDLQSKQAVEKSRLVEEKMLSRQESRQYCYKAAPGTEEQQLLLSDARTRAAGGGEVKTGEEELLSVQEQK